MKNVNSSFVIERQIDIFFPSDEFCNLYDAAGSVLDSQHYIHPWMKAVKTFSRGTKALLADMKEYSWVNHVLTETSDWQKACLTLSRRQLEVKK